MKAKLLFHCTVIVFLGIFLTTCGRQPVIDGQESRYSSPLELAHAFLANPDYLKECSRHYVDQAKEQIGYLGIFPGATKEDELQKLIGKPRQTQFPSAPDELLYQGYSVEISSGVVKYVFVSESLQGSSTLKEVLEKFGCPSLIYGFDGAMENPSGHYSQISFVYLISGVEVLFMNFPVALDEPVTMITFFEPQSIDKITEDVRSDWQTFDLVKPLLWEEAIE